MLKRKKGILVFLLLLIVLVTTAFIGAEIFQIQKITVLDNEKIVYNDIIRISGVSIGQNILKLNKDMVEKHVSTHPYVESAKVSLKLPNEVVIEINERTPAAIVPYLSSYVIIDVNGVIIEISKDLSGHDYPVVTGILLRNFNVGSAMDTGSNYQTQALTLILQEIYTQKVEEGISEIIIDDPDNIFFMMDDGMLIRIGQASQLSSKLRWLKIDYNEQIEGHSGGIMDISMPKKAVFYPADESLDQNIHDEDNQD